jgi:hypothetical protein
MNRAHRWHRTLGVALFAALPVLAAVPIASADPGDPAPVDPVSGNAPPPASADPAGADMSPDTHDAVSTACRQFGAALDLASSNYEDFAYATAGNGNAVNYQDPNVAQSNLRGRTALREAASAALEVAGTPGLPGDVADPMRTWSLHATKLVLIMGLRGGGDSLNSAATDLNTDANNVQMACALNGSRA